MKLFSQFLFALFFGLLAFVPINFAVAEEPKPAATGGATAVADPPEPPPLTEYMGRRIAQTMHYTGAPWLMRETREREEDCKTLMKVLDLKPGMVVCDMGCGNGFYAFKVAKEVGDKGRVLCVDIQKEMLAMLRKGAKELELTNIEPILGGFTDPKLPAGQLDMVLMVDVYHEFSNPVEMLAGIRKSLKPDGKIVQVEFRTEDPKVPIKPEHKMSKDQILKELLPNGFKLVGQFDGLPWQHVMFFQRDDSVKVELHKDVEKVTPDKK